MAINRTALKNYAPQARVDFIKAITNRAAQFGITKDGVSKGDPQGELFIVEGTSFPRSVGVQRAKLVDRINLTSFEQVMEAVAYTWFNRFLAIRYMEIHGYFDHGYRVLSHPQGHKEPEILEKAASLDLPGLKHDSIVAMKLDGKQDEALYRKILVAQCNALHQAMPFLFEKIEDETELLLPENLLQSDSITRRLVSAIDEVQWGNIEIIGWLYQFYISEKKEQVIGKVVKSADIPAATQLFTPNWIVKYLVQNSLGSAWLTTYPGSGLKREMRYHVDPPVQSPDAEVESSLLVPKSLNPESLTLIDPAVGSGHILVEAYDLFKAIYIERGYTAKEAARLILTKNLYGVDIDDRAAQMAGFALLMRARADDRNLLISPPRLNVIALQESNGLDVEAIVERATRDFYDEPFATADLLPETLPQPNLSSKEESDLVENAKMAMRQMMQFYRDAKTFGSLLAPTAEITSNIRIIREFFRKRDSYRATTRNIFVESIETIDVFLKQTELLSANYDFVVANPPYMNNGNMNPKLSKFVASHFKSSKFDMYSVFMERNIALAGPLGSIAMITIPNWMFLPSFGELREIVYRNTTITSLIHNGRGVWGSDFGSCAFILKKGITSGIGLFKRLFREQGEVNGNDILAEHYFDDNAFPWVTHSNADFSAIPGKPISYWVSDDARRAFANPKLTEFAYSGGRCMTSNDEYYLRFFWELNRRDVGLGNKWCLMYKGGEYRKYYGNLIHAMRWDESSREYYKTVGGLTKSEFWDKVGITWSTVTANANSSFRLKSFGAQYNSVSRTIFFENQEETNFYIALLNSRPSNYFLQILNPTLAINVGDVLRVPMPSDEMKRDDISGIGAKLVGLHTDDWNEYETSWGFAVSPMVSKSKTEHSVQNSYLKLRNQQKQRVRDVQQLEGEMNRAFANAYHLDSDFESDVVQNEITLTSNPYYRYGCDFSDAELETRQKSDTMRELISYAVGCMMGRYSIVEPGEIFTQSNSPQSDANRFGPFLPDADGIIPVTEERWFKDDAANRLEEFLSVAWPSSVTSENRTFLIEGLIKGHSQEPVREMRTYFAKKFYSDHLQTYKNRPIYWLFSSGKEKAFECLVYLHRYNEGTLARMRTEYVTPLMGKVLARIEALENEIAQSSSSAEKTRKNKDVTNFRKQLVELRAFDEELRHLADQRIALDLDDGVKVNYGKFGNLLAAKDKVCGKRDDAA